MFMSVCVRWNWNSHEAHTVYGWILTDGRQVGWRYQTQLMVQIHVFVYMTQYTMYSNMYVFIFHRSLLTLTVVFFSFRGIVVLYLLWVSTFCYPFSFWMTLSAFGSLWKALQPLFKLLCSAKREPQKPPECAVFPMPSGMWHLWGSGTVF